MNTRRREIRRIVNRRTSKLESRNSLGAMRFGVLGPGVSSFEFRSLWFTPIKQPWTTERAGPVPQWPCAVAGHLCRQIAQDLRADYLRPRLHFRAPRRQA